MTLLPIVSFDRWKSPQPPRFLFFELNQQCNLKCKHCMYWTNEEVELPGHISIERRAAIVEEFAQLNQSGTVVICGGESMLNPERYFPLTRQCRQLGLKCICVVNGTKIVNDSDAEEMIVDGPSEITVSVNSHDAEVHDRTRGMVGSFDLAVGAIRLLLAARQRLNRNTPIYAMAVVCEQNYRDLDAFYDFVLNDLRADKLKLNFLQPTFGPLESMPEDKFFRDNVIADEVELGQILDACNKKYDLKLNPEWMEVVKMYHRSVRDNGDSGRGWDAVGTERPICNSYERNIMVDMFGEARLCYSTGFPGTLLKRPGDLEKFWCGNGRLRQRMAACKQYCGISHSVRRVSATLRSEAESAA